MQDECKEATHISASPVVFGLDVSKCIKIKMHKYAVQILIQSFAVSIKQNSLIFQTTLLTFYRFLGDNMEDITAALAEFPSESSLSRNYFLYISCSLFAGHLVRPQVRVRASAAEEHQARAFIFHAHCTHEHFLSVNNLHTWSDQLFSNCLSLSEQVWSLCKM